MMEPQPLECHNQQSLMENHTDKDAVSSTVSMRTRHGHGDLPEEGHMRQCHSVTADGPIVDPARAVDGTWDISSSLSQPQVLDDCSREGQ